MGYNPSKSTWLNPNIEYLFDDEIIEYDIQDAGFSLIKQFHLLPDDKIRELASLDKGDERHRAVGMLQKDREFSKILLDKFAEVRTVFISVNNISDNDIVSVKKDAIYTIGPCRRLKFGLVNFVAKNRYSSYIRFPDVQNLEIYYSTEVMHVKGIGDSAINRHRLYMMEFIRQIISMIESNNPRAKRYLMEFIRKYKTQELEDEYYLEFNNLSRNLNPIFNFQKIIVPITNIILREME